MANYSSFIEFFAAIYVTMSLSNDLFLRFWTPNHKKKIDAILKQHTFPGGDSQYKFLTNEIEELTNQINNSSIKRGAFMLSYCVLMLIYIGLEDDSQNLASSVALMGASTLTFMITIFHKRLLGNWKSVILAIITVIISYIVIQSKFDCWIHQESFTFNIHVVAQYVVLAVILFPILHQLLINWLYSRVYRGYLSAIVKMEYEKYNQSKNGIQTRNKSIVDEEYLNVWNDSYFTSGQYDLSLKGFNDVLKNRLLQAISPSVITLFISLIKYKIELYCDKLKKLFRKSQNQNKVANDGSQSLTEMIQYQVKSYSKEYDEYLKWKERQSPNSCSLRQYCKQFDINYTAIVEWVKRVRPPKR